MTEVKTDARPVEKPEAEDPERRNLALALFGALGAAGLLDACAAEPDGLPPGPTAEPIGQVIQAAFVAGTLRFADNVADLRGNTGAAGTVAILKCYATASPNDGGGGVFFWDTAAVDDGGTFFNNATPPTTAPGWRRIFSGSIDLVWYGASATATGLANYNALVAALKTIAAKGKGTILVSDLYPLGYANWNGIEVGAIDSFPTIPTPINSLGIVATRPGAGFQLTNAITTTGVVPYAFKFIGCGLLRLQGLTLDGGGFSNGLLFMQLCTDAAIVENLFSRTSSAVNYTLYAIGGTNNRFQGNSFESCAGTAVGYVNSGQHEEGAIILGNRYDSTNSFAQIYVCIRNGTIANNVFRNTQSNGALALLGDHLATEVCDNLTITGNSFLNTGFGVRGDPTGSLGQTTPMRNIVITGNTFENVGPDAAIGITICNGLVVSGNVLVNCNSTVVYILGVNDAVVSNNVWEWTNGANNGWAISCGAYISGYGYSYTASNIHIHSNSISGHLAGVNVASVTAGPPGFALQVLCTGVTISHNTLAGLTWGILINDRTADVAIIGNKILPSASWDCQIATTCQIRDNQMGAPLINMQSDPTVTYYFQREGGQKVFRPSATQPPNSPPSGASYSFATGDVTYSSNPVPGSAVAWVYSNGAWHTTGTVGT